MGSTASMMEKIAQKFVVRVTKREENERKTLCGAVMEEDVKMGVRKQWFDIPAHTADYTKDLYGQRYDFSEPFDPDSQQEPENLHNAMDEKNRMDIITFGIKKLDPAKDFTQDGKPDCIAINKVLGFPLDGPSKVTAEERDKTWAFMKPVAPEPQEEQ